MLKIYILFQEKSETKHIIFLIQYIILKAPLVKPVK